MQNIMIIITKLSVKRGSAFPTQLLAIDCKGGLYSLAGSLENNILGIIFPTLNCSTLEKLGGGGI